MWTSRTCASPPSSHHPLWPNTTPISVRQSSVCSSAAKARTVATDQRPDAESPATQQAAAGWPQPLASVGNRLPVVALGKFDALHRGHRALAAEAAAMGGQPWLVSFSGMAEVLGEHLLFRHRAQQMPFVYLYRARLTSSTLYIDDRMQPLRADRCHSSMLGHTTSYRKVNVDTTHSSYMSCQMLANVGERNLRITRLAAPVAAGCSHGARERATDVGAVLLRLCPSGAPAAIRRRPQHEPGGLRQAAQPGLARGRRRGRHKLPLRLQG